MGSEIEDKGCECYGCEKREETVIRKEIGLVVGRIG